MEIVSRDEELVANIRAFEPDIMVKGSDYVDQAIIGQDIIEIVFFGRIEEYSSTKKIMSIKESK